LAWLIKKKADVSCWLIFIVTLIDSNDFNILDDRQLSAIISTASEDGETKT
jgi:hypothetical protein